VFAVAPGFEPSRISFPLTYWNALGLLAGIGLILCFSLTSDERESAVLRVLAGAAIPILAVPLLLTFSRGAVGVTIVGLVSYLLLAHNRGLVTGALAVGPLTGLAVVRAYEADLLATRTPSSPGAIAQGHALAETMLVCVLGVVVLRAALLVVDGCAGSSSLAPPSNPPPLDEEERDRERRHVGDDQEAAEQIAARVASQVGCRAEGSGARPRLVLPRPRRRGRLRRSGTALTGARLFGGRCSLRRRGRRQHLELAAQALASPARDRCRSRARRPRVQDRRSPPRPVASQAPLPLATSRIACMIDISSVLARYDSLPHSPTPSGDLQWLSIS